MNIWSALAAAYCIGAMVHYYMCHEPDDTKGEMFVNSVLWGPLELAYACLCLIDAAIRYIDNVQD